MGFSQGQNIGACGFGWTRGFRKKFSLTWFEVTLSLLKKEGETLRFELDDSLDLFKRLSEGVTI